ncbi:MULTISPECIES: hypothetical protein [Halobacterium]|uniref:hypothetical protein n=1 Tax=Halobacterium TaxID=2239 RepID=UPI0019640F2B|nr:MULTISPECIES: hypothetical protein [Halobacterium]MCF2164462.1 hypothetical protein [Halobacterium salinarum]MCF2167249.1 hypothetical protein [Halobacterium salinarum]MCF2206518.1 hypothetical protein [Halobacterium salinarum]MCF2239066.1 hypothetical protein [Halobacterium salinarum]MDL0122775.1 hypothetical protein [Halobacterium salinarum]
MELAEYFERAGIVVGSMLMVSLPASLVLWVVTGPATPWWETVAQLAPGFVIGWWVAVGRAPVEYATVWFTSLFGYLLASAVMAALNVRPVGANRVWALIAVIGSLAVVGLVDHYRS